MADQNYKQNDLAPVMADTLGAITGQTGVLVVWRLQSNHQIRRSGAATVNNESTGEVEYQPVVGDFAVAGTYDLHWEVTLPTGKQTIPADGYRELVVAEQI